MLKKLYLLYPLFVFSTVLNYVVNQLIARHLGPVDYGDFVTALFSINFAASLIMFGADGALLRYLPRLFGRKDYFKIAGLMHEVLQHKYWVMVFLFFVGLILSILYLFLHFLLHFSFVLHPFFLTLWLIPLAIFYILLIKLIQASGRVILPMFASSVILPLIQIVAYVIILQFIDRKLNLVDLFLVYTFCLLLMIFICYRLLGADLIKRIFQVRVNKHHTRWQKLSRTIFLSNLFFSYCDVVAIDIIDLLSKNDYLSGHLAVIFNLTNFLLIPFYSVSFWLAPQVSLLLYGNKEKLQHYMIDANYFCFANTFLIMVLITVFGKKMLMAFGHNYIDAYAALLVSGWMMVPLSLMLTSFFVLEYSRHVKILGKISLIMFAVLILVTVVGCYYFNLMGVVISLGACLLLYFALMAWFVHRLFRLTPF